MMQYGSEYVVSEGFTNSVTEDDLKHIITQYISTVTACVSAVHTGKGLASLLSESLTCMHTAILRA